MIATLLNTIRDHEFLQSAKEKLTEAHKHVREAAQEEAMLRKVAGGLAVNNLLIRDPRPADMVARMKQCMKWYKFDLNLKPTTDLPRYTLQLFNEYNKSSSSESGAAPAKPASAPSAASDSAQSTAASAAGKRSKFSAAAAAVAAKSHSC